MKSVKVGRYIEGERIKEVGKESWNRKGREGYKVREESS